MNLLQVLSHPECSADVLEESDFIGSSEVLINESRLGKEGKNNIMLITECGTADRVLAESNDEMNIMGTCVMCRHMKTTLLEDILQSLREPKDEQIIQLEKKL